MHWDEHLSLAHGHKVFAGELFLRPGVVGIGVQHDEGKGEQVGAIRTAEGPLIVPAVALRKFLHDAINLLGLTCAKTEMIEPGSHFA